MLADEEDPQQVMLALQSKTAELTTPESLSSLSRISVPNESFTDNQSFASSDGTIEYTDGWIENKSHEPDSRFEMKTSGNKSVGKIRMEGAANQALHHFSTPSGKPEGAGTDGSVESAHAIRPLIAAATAGKISVETLSWLGAIARRYGLDEKGRDLGRQASRRGRQIMPADE